MSFVSFVLLVAERYQRIGLRRAARRQHACDQRHADQHGGDGGHNRRIHRAGFVELRLQYFSDFTKFLETQVTSQSSR